MLVIPFVPTRRLPFTSNPSTDKSPGVPPPAADIMPSFITIVSLSG